MNIKISKMSILKDLNPDIRKAIEADKEKYPNNYKKMIREMQDATVVTDLSVGTASTLISEGEVFVKPIVSSWCFCSRISIYI